MSSAVPGGLIRRSAGSRSDLVMARCRRRPRAATACHPGDALAENFSQLSFVRKRNVEERSGAKGIGKLTLGIAGDDDQGRGASAGAACVSVARCHLRHRKRCR